MDEKQVLFKELIALGVNRTRAWGFVDENSPAYVRQKIGYYGFALRTGQARNAGWLFCALRDGWGPPLGWGEEEEDELAEEGANEVEGDAAVPGEEGLALWAEVCEGLRRQVTVGTYRAYVEDLTVLSWDGSTLRVGAPSSERAVWLRSRLLRVFARVAAEVVGYSVEVEFAVR